MRLRMTIALENPDTLKGGYGCYHFGDSDRFSIYFMFPKLTKDLVENNELAQLFFDLVLRDTFLERESHYGAGADYVGTWTAVKSEHSDPEGYHGPMTIPVHPSTTDFGKWWQLIQDKVNSNPKLKKLRGLFLAVAFPAKGHHGDFGSGSTEEEAWNKAMRHSSRHVDMRYVAKDTIHTTFRTVAPASRLASPIKHSYDFNGHEQDHVYGVL